MSRNRVNYQCEALYGGPSPATGFYFLDGVGNKINDITGSNLVEILHRVQSAGYDFTVSRIPVNQYGELAAIDRVIDSTPIVNFQFDYLLASFQNERKIGLKVNDNISAISGFLDGTEDSRNYFVKTVQDGNDAIGDLNTGSVVSVLGIGNAYLDSYSSEGAIGSFPRVSVGFQALNMVFDEATNLRPSPAISPKAGTHLTGILYTLPAATSNPGTGSLATSVIRPGDIKLTVTQADAEGKNLNSVDASGVYNTFGVDINDANIQSYSLEFSLNRTVIEALGSRFAIDRAITPPIPINVEIGALVGDLTTGSLSDIINCDKSYNIDIKLHEPDCDDIPLENRTVLARYLVKNAKLDSQSYSSSIGANKSVSMRFSAQMGGIRDSGRGLFLYDPFTGEAAASEPEEDTCSGCVLQFTGDTTGGGDTFDCYETGLVTTELNCGSGWSGPWRIGEGFPSARIEDFESYETGDLSGVTLNNSLEGFTGPWRIGNSFWLMDGFDDFENYNTGSASGQDLTAGFGFAEEWRLGDG